MAETADGYLGIGGLAAALGVSRAAVRRWEVMGWIEPAPRMGEGDRRVFRPADVEIIRQRVDARRAAAGHRRLAERQAA